MLHCAWCDQLLGFDNEDPLNEGGEIYCSGGCFLLYLDSISDEQEDYYVS